MHTVLEKKRFETFLKIEVVGTEKYKYILKQENISNLLKNQCTTFDRFC